jgi:hypothetical protein
LLEAETRAIFNLPPPKKEEPKQEEPAPTEGADVEMKDEGAAEPKAE